MKLLGKSFHFIQVQLSDKSKLWNENSMVLIRLWPLHLLDHEEGYKWRQVQFKTIRELSTIFIAAFSAVARIQRNLGVHSPRQRKCNTHTYWSSIQPLKRRDSSHFNRAEPGRHHVKWNKPVINTTWSHLYVNSENIELRCWELKGG